MIIGQYVVPRQYFNWRGLDAVVVNFHGGRLQRVSAKVLPSYKMENGLDIDSSTLPKSYRRMIARKTGESFRDVAEIDEAEMMMPGDGEVLIRVLYAGINGGCETFRARGEFAFSSNIDKDTFALGAEGAGVVVAVGENNIQSDLQVGTHVTFVGGAFSEYVCAKASLCWPIPVSRPEYVAATISGTVANAALKKVAGMKKDDIVFVSAGAGATGSFAVQLAALAGCHVVTSCGNPEKAKLLREILDNINNERDKGRCRYRIIEYSKESVEDVLRTEYPEKIDIAYEGVGGAIQQAVWENLAPGGRLLVVGYISEYPHVSESSSNEFQTCLKETKQPPLPPSKDLFWKGLTVKGIENRIALGNVWPSDRNQILEAKKEVFDLLEKGNIRAVVDEKKFRNLETVPDAIEFMLSSKAIGKVICQLQEL